MIFTYNEFSPSVEERILDATNFTEFLHSHQTKYGLYYNLNTDSDGSLNKVFWVLKDSIEQ